MTNLTDTPTLVCGHPLTWPGWVWRPNPHAGFYCGFCQRIQPIGSHPEEMDQWTIFEEWAWSSLDRVYGCEGYISKVRKESKERTESECDLFPGYQLPVWDYVRWERSGSLEANLEPENP